MESSLSNGVFFVHLLSARQRIKVIPKAKQMGNANKKQKHHNAKSNDLCSIAERLGMEDLPYWVMPIINEYQ